MKEYLILFLFAFIICKPILKKPFSMNKYFIPGMRKILSICYKSIIECINEKGSQTLKNIFENIESIKIGKIIKDNEDILSREDLDIFDNCRKRYLNDYIKIRKKRFGSTKKIDYRQSKKKYIINT